MNRFGDIEISNKQLTSVYDYHAEPLVSLEQALEPIESQIMGLSVFIRTAKQYCHYPSEHGLTKDESASIYIYTMEWNNTSLYCLLNRALRLEDRSGLKIWFPYLKLFTTALDKLPTVKKILWRGLPIDIRENLVRDQILTWWGFSSCSESINVIKDFLGKEENATIFIIEAFNGKKISGYTKYEYEEVILPMGTQLRVQGDPSQQLNGPYIVQLVELSNNQTESNTATTPLLSSPPEHKNPQLEEMIKNNKYPEALDLCHVKLTDDDMEIVAYYSLNNTNYGIKKLTHENGQIGDKGMQYLAAALQNNTTLRVLWLKCNQIGDQGAKYLGEALEKNIGLTRLVLGQNKIGSQGVKYLGEGLQNNITLEELELDYNQIGSQGAKYLFESLQHNTGITSVKLDKTQIGVEGAKYLSEYLKKNTTLQYLSLYGNEIRDEGVKYLCEALEKNTTLLYLGVNGNIIGLKGAKYLSECLQKNTTLNHLDLSHNPIRNQGVKYLSEALAKNTKLKTLALWNCQIEHQGAQYLLEGLQKNKTLTGISLADNEMTGELSKVIYELVKKNKL